ncbi:LytTR family transcriptional regulator [Aerophototrophica crusticola]|uniref:LytTR family transcriptional regulator n=2 Tax=Aerophototrophica crusticola TaxID=1709002 RepID=A0A858RBA7_9PROT|nr:LytTR family transcriptional regulator [Rhodospirillaceae bacterium B3]
MVLAVGALLGRIGPFGTFADLTTAERFAYWLGLTTALWVQVAVVLYALRPRVRHQPLWMQAGLAALLGAVPTTFEVAWAEALLRLGGVLTPLSMLKTYGDVCLIALALAIPLEYLRGHVLWPERTGAGPADVVPEPEQAPVAGAMAGPCRFLERVPAKLRGTLLAVQAEDHYLRVHTDLGSDLILCRFGDALAELEGTPGLRVHRSWWVAGPAVVRAEREGDRTVLVLSNGLRVPVSRSYGLAVRDAGWVGE